MRLVGAAIAAMLLLALPANVAAQSGSGPGAWPACPASDPGSVPDPPESVPTLDPARFPPPPATFDPGAVRFLGSPYASAGYGDPAWTSAIDGSDMRCVAPATGEVVFAKGGRIVYTAPPVGRPDERRSLFVREPDGSTRELFRAARTFTVTGDGRTAIVVRYVRTDGGAAEDRGIWRVPLDGTTPQRVMRPRPWRTAVFVVASSDGRRVAVGDYLPPDMNFDHVPPVLVRVGRAPVRRLPYGFPHGFDARGRVIYTRLHVNAWDPRTGRTAQLSADDRDARVTASGRWVILEPWSKRGYRQHVTAIRVADGLRWNRRLAPGSWSLVPGLSTDRHVVLQDTCCDGDSTKFAVADLRERWIGYIRFQARPDSWAAMTSATSRPIDSLPRPYARAVRASSTSSGSSSTCRAGS